MHSAILVKAMRGIQLIFLILGVSDVFCKTDPFIAYNITSKSNMFPVFNKTSNSKYGIENLAPNNICIDVQSGRYIRQGPNFLKLFSITKLPMHSLSTKLSDNESISVKSPVKSDINITSIGSNHKSTKCLPYIPIAPIIPNMPSTVYPPFIPSPSYPYPHSEDHCSSHKISEEPLYSPSRPCKHGNYPPCLSCRKHSSYGHGYLTETVEFDYSNSNKSIISSRSKRSPMFSTCPGILLSPIALIHPFYPYPLSSNNPCFPEDGREDGSGSESKPPYYLSDSADNYPESIELIRQIKEAKEKINETNSKADKMKKMIKRLKKENAKKRNRLKQLIKKCRQKQQYNLNQNSYSSGKSKLDFE